MPLILGANSVSGGYNVANSLRFNSGSSDNLSRTTWGTATSDKIFTMSIWVKRSNLSSTQQLASAYDGTTGNDNQIKFNSSDQLSLTVSSSGAEYFLTTTQVFRDVSAWYHIVFAYDSTQATSSNRYKLYVNGSQITTFGTANYPTQNLTYQFFRNSNANRIGSTWNGGEYLNGYLSEFYFIDGQALDSSSFGETDTDTNIWIPKEYTGTFGTNGFYLDFEDSSNLGNDMSGNNNDFTVNNLTSIDQSTDTCTNNFCTGNPLSTYSNRTITEGNTVLTSTTTSWTNMISSIAVNTGKWYIEAKATAGSFHSIGIVDVVTYFNNENSSIGDYTVSNQQIGYYSNSGNKKVNQTTSSYGNTWTNGDIIGIALDLDNNYIYFSKNGTFQNSGVPTSGATGTGGISITSGVYYAIAVAVYNSSAMSFNFGSPSFTIASGNADGAGYGNFEYAVPSGYYSLCTKNLAQFG